jgi:glucuronate isomerase
MLFDPDPTQRRLAGELYASVSNLPIISPHGHVDPWLFADEKATFGTPTDLLIIPDHYVFRMLYSQGIPLESLGVPRQDGSPVESDHRKIWQTFADHFHLFRATPSGLWLKQELNEVFNCEQPLNSSTAQDIYDHIQTCLDSDEYKPRRLFEHFRIEVLCTTDPAWDRLEAHQALRASGWAGGAKIRPTFRPDGVINLDAPNWRTNLEQLSQASGIEINSVTRLVQALEIQRAHFKSLGASATDHAALLPAIQPLSPQNAEAIFQRALRGEFTMPQPTALKASPRLESATPEHPASQETLASSILAAPDAAPTGRLVAAPTESPDDRAQDAPAQAETRQALSFSTLSAPGSAPMARLVTTTPVQEPQPESSSTFTSTNHPDVAAFTGHMLYEMARMSVEDGLVMQIHPGSLRNHNLSIVQRFGLDKGADIPIPVEFTRNLQPLLNSFGNDPRFHLILFTLDESTYARELAPLAGHYPAVLLGPPWWFNDSPNGIRRYLDQVIETAGLYNTAGFNDDTRAFPSIPARHDVWRRACANWLAGLVLSGAITEQDAAEMIVDLAVRLARRAYRLEEIS